MVAIVDYGLGNLASVQKAFNFLNVENCITNNAEEIQKAKYIVLPGVGSFTQGMKNLQDAGLDQVITKEVIEKGKPFLGICLGMQLIFSEGSEPNHCKGLGWIEGHVGHFKQNGLRIPHMGWNTIHTNESSWIKSSGEKDFYFIHSYHVEPDHSEVIAATVNYGEDIVAAVQKNNIYACQFHPEKSQKEGLQILQKFISDNA